MDGANRIVVADYKQSQLVWIDPKGGGIIRTLTDARLAPMSGLTFDDSSENLLVVARTTNVDQVSLLAFTPAGELTPLSTDKLVAPGGMAAIGSAPAKHGQLVSGGRFSASMSTQPLRFGPPGGSLATQPALSGSVTNRGRAQRVVINSFGVTGGTSVTLRASLIDTNTGNVLAVSDDFTETAPALIDETGSWIARGSREIAFSGRNRIAISAAASYALRLEVVSSDWPCCGLFLSDGSFAVLGTLR